MTETVDPGSFCPDCGLYDCRTKKLADEVARLRAELATLREREQLLVDSVQKAVDRSDRSAPKERDNISRNTLVEDLGFALLAHRQRNNDGNR